jgi:hypothetical protein
MLTGIMKCKVYKPELLDCPICKSKLKYAYATSNKVVQFSKGNKVRIKNLAYHCLECNNKITYISNTANKLSFKGYSYSSKVICLIDYYKSSHLSRDKICDLLEAKGIDISDRNIDIIAKMFVEYLDMDYDKKIRDSYEEMLKTYTEIRLSIDCIRVAEVAYIIYYNYFTGEILAIWKFTNDADIEFMLRKYLSITDKITTIITVRPGRKLYNILKEIADDKIRFVSYEKF